jgi:phage recombination protein Bet
LKGTVKHREALDKQIASALFSPLTEEKMPDDKILPFKALTESMADRFEVAPKELLDTVRAVCFKGAASDAQLMMLLSFAKNYDLNPLAKECYAFVKEGRMSIGVQVDGWSKIANRQDNYDGQEIEYENDKDGKVVSITSRTYVKGRAKPTVYRAMMSEWNRKTDVWASMPTHQLYVKARNQGVRFAFGIPAYDPDDMERIEKSTTQRAVETTATVVKDDPKVSAKEAGNSRQAGNVAQDSLVAEKASAAATPKPPPSGTAAAPAEAVTHADPPAASAPSATGEAPDPRTKLDKAYDNLRTHLDALIARHVKDARLKLLLGQVGAVSVEAATDEQIAMLIQRIEARRGK